MEISEIYKQLTDVDIAEQKQLWDERGKGYYGEYLLFCELYKKLPGNCKILMNLDIPVNESKTTEVDLVLIHETGLYVFEIKHYKGTIYGKDIDDCWTQYFRTAKNNKFRNPIEQNKYHISAISKMYPDFPIHSIIVFTSDECEIKVTNTNTEIDICSLEDVMQVLENRFHNATKKISMTDIDIFFKQLSAFSHIQDIVEIDGTQAPFISWILPTINKLENAKNDIEQGKQIIEYKTKELDKITEDKIKALKKKQNIGIVINVLIAVACIIFSAIVISGFKTQYDFELYRNTQELESFKQNFLHVDEIEDEYIEALNSYVIVSDVELSQPITNAVSFTAKITIPDDTYGIIIQENARYIVMTESGMVLEYNVFGTNLSYNLTANTLGSGYALSGKLAPVLFGGISSQYDISYIKLTGIQLIKMDANKTVIKDNLELELYTK